MSIHFNEPGPIFVLADKEMTVRVIWNLIRNCAQHSNGDIEVKLIADQTAKLSFKNAVNEAMEIDVNRLFERFYTADKARSGNVGLGLSIVKHLTEQMGGKTNAVLLDGFIEIKVELPIFG